MREIEKVFNSENWFFQENLLFQSYADISFALKNQIFKRSFVLYKYYL